MCLEGVSFKYDIFLTPFIFFSGNLGASLLSTSALGNFTILIPPLEIKVPKLRRGGFIIVIEII